MELLIVFGTLMTIGIMWLRTLKITIGLFLIGFIVIIGLSSFIVLVSFPIDVFREAGKILSSLYVNN